VFASYEAAYSYAGKLNIITELEKQDYVLRILSEESKANILTWLDN
jgi:hypothetical protein